MDKKTVDKFLEEPVVEQSLVESLSHLCWVYANESEQLDAFEPSVIQALLEHKQCLMALPKDIWEKAALRLAVENIDIPGYVDNGQIVYTTPQEILFSDDELDVDIIIGRLQAACRRARAQGWAGLSVVLDASDFIEKADISKWLDYELRTDYECSLGSCVMLCMYDSRRLTGELLAMIVKSHPIIGMGSGLKINPFYMQNNSRQPQ